MDEKTRKLLQLLKDKCGVEPSPDSVNDIQVMKQGDDGSIEESSIDDFIELLNSEENFAEAYQLVDTVDGWNFFKTSLSLCAKYEPNGVHSNEEKDSVYMLSFDIDKAEVIYSWSNYTTIGPMGSLISASPMGRTTDDFEFSEKTMQAAINMVVKQAELVSPVYKYVVPTSNVVDTFNTLALELVADAVKSGRIDVPEPEA